MHYPCRFRASPTARQQNLALVVNILIGIVGSSFRVFLVKQAYEKEVANAGDDWVFAHEHPTYLILLMMEYIINPFIPASGIVVLAAMNSRKLAAVANFDRNGGCWNLRLGKLMSIQAWIHKELRLCTSMALVHIFQFVPNAVLSILYYEGHFDFFQHPAYSITWGIITTIQQAGFSVHILIYIAFCPSYRQAVGDIFARCIRPEIWRRLLSNCKHARRVAFWRRNSGSVSFGEQF